MKMIKGLTNIHEKGQFLTDVSDLYWDEKTFSESQ